MEAEHLELVRPLTLGTHLSGGWLLVEAAVPSGGEFNYVFRSRDGAASALRVFVCRKELGQRGYRDTTYYVVGYHSEPGARLSPSALQLMEDVVDLVSRNEREPRPLAAVPPGPSPGASPLGSQGAGGVSAPTLFLVPGHLGDAGDLGSRALQVLAQAPNILVEAGTAASARAILEAAGLDPATKRLVEIEVDPTTGREQLDSFRQIVERSESVALFGVAEGAPAFVDPGSGIIAEARRLGVAVRSVGGPSALTQALMRLEEDVQEFLFVGRLEGPADVGRMERRARSVPDVALILFTDGGGCRTLLPALLNRVPWTRGWLLADLTTDRERVVALTAEAAPDPESIREDARVVVVLHQRPE